MWDTAAFLTNLDNCFYCIIIKLRGWGADSFRFHFVSLFTVYCKRRNENEMRTLSLVLMSFAIPQPTIVQVLLSWHSLRSSVVVCSGEKVDLAFSRARVTHLIDHHGQTFVKIEKINGCYVDLLSLEESLRLPEASMSSLTWITARDSLTFSQKLDSRVSRLITRAEKTRVIISRWFFFFSIGRHFKFPALCISVGSRFMIGCI